jgi:alpha-D-ribose 1-methylphosphonate 5-triphosphate synthase subunit PhnH
MSTSTLTRSYDPVFDSQKHYRVLLNCTARPGSIGLLNEVEVEKPAELSQSSSLIALMLFSSDVSFFLGRDASPAAGYLVRQTRAIEAPVAEADFVFVHGRDNEDAVAALRSVKAGEPAFPETGATVLLEVEAISPAPLADCLRLTLSGPGIETASIVYVAGIDPKFLETLQSRNCEFPVGVDVYLTCDSVSAGPCVLSLPRTTRVSWETVLSGEKRGDSWAM